MHEVCGITGVYGRDDRQSVVRMAQAIKHRGPDDEGFYSDDRVCLGHKRLSIIDLNT